jgi:tetratricopeptide (TPR) repeat protein
MSIFVARLLVRQGRIDDAHELLVAIESRVVSLDDPATAIEYWYARCAIPNTRRDGLRTLEAARRVAELAVAVGDRLMEGHAALLRGCAYQHTSELTRAMREFDRADEIYRAIGSSTSIQSIRNNRASTLFQIGRITESAALLRTQYDELKAAGSNESIYFAASNLGCALLADGRIDEALGLQSEALDLARAMNSDGFAALALGDLGAAEIAAGHAAAGLAHLHEAIALNRRLDRTAVLAHDLARAAGAEPRPADGAAHARGALAIVEADPSAIALAPEILNRCAHAFERAADTAAAAYCRRKARAIVAARLRLLEDHDRDFYLAIPWHASLFDAGVRCADIIVDAHSARDLTSSGRAVPR